MSCFGFSSFFFRWTRFIIRNITNLINEHYAERLVISGPFETSILGDSTSHRCISFRRQRVWWYYRQLKGIFCKVYCNVTDENERSDFRFWSDRTRKRKLFPLVRVRLLPESKEMSRTPEQTSIRTKQC